MSSASNYDDVVAQMRAFGLIFDYIDTGRMRRCKIQDSRERKGWYAIHPVINDEGETLLVGSYGIWQGADNNAQKIKISTRKLSKDQLTALKARLAEDKRRAEAQRKRENERAAARAEAVWQKCLPAGDSDYLKKKGIKSYGLRYTESGSLAVPMLDSYGRIHGLQFILPPGHARKKKTGRDKEFWPAGMAMKGHYFLIGTPIDVLLIAEGYATAASLHEATGLPVAVAFNANNLLPVAQALRKRYQKTSILVCGDDDYMTDGNPGMTSASAAALAIAGVWMIPIFTIDRENKKITDFNDLHTLEGLHLVRSQVEAKLHEHKWAVDKLAAVLDNRGEGGLLKPLLNVPEAVERFSLIYGGRNAMFDHAERIVVHKDDVLNICVDRAWSEWKLHIERKVVRLTEVGFDPTGLDNQIKCNLWGGWPTKAKEGSCDKLLALLSYLCMEDDKNGNKLYDWLLKWLAYPIQHAGAKMQSAVVVHGVQGTGKSRFFEAYASIFGEYGLVLDQGAIEDKFNSDWASKRLFVLADEIVARQDMYHIKNRLKTFITGKTIRINPKSLTVHTERNHMNIVFLSNEKMPVALENDDRRHCIIWTPPMPDDDFFEELNAEIEADGAEALHHYLVNLDLANFKPWTKPPMTDSKHDLIDLGLDSSERFLRDWQQGETRWPFMPCGSMDLYSAYAKWCRENGVARQRESNQFLGHIKKMRGWTNSPRHRYDNEECIGTTRQTRMVTPDIELLKKSEIQAENGQTQSQWLTKCFFEFHRSLEDAR